MDQVETRVEFVAADIPEANRLTVHILALVAQAEREAHGSRVKLILANNWLLRIGGLSSVLHRRVNAICRHSRVTGGLSAPAAWEMCLRRAAYLPPFPVARLPCAYLPHMGDQVLT
jgi:hypothetical protein